MARNTTRIAAPPEAVWAILQDPYAYPRWVVGSARTLEASPAWPAPASAFRVRLAAGPTDRTVVREVEPERRLVLDAGTELFGPARVTIELRPLGDGTEVTMIEDPAGKALPLRFLPPVHLALRLRNAESLRRLRRLAEQRSGDRLASAR
jgi:uncharacterized protein YndB with AHSA1/START domain